MSEDFNITDLFFEASRKYPARPAIINRERTIAFGEFAEAINATAAHFLEKGIRKGDRVLVFVPMSIELYRIVLALFRIGATAVFLDEWVNKERMEACCKVAQCNAFIGSFKVRMLSLLSRELRKIPIRLGVRMPGAAPQKWARPRVTFHDTALITFTTGSTGTPKAAKRTHGFLLEQFAALNEKLDPQPGDINMPVLPIVLLINLGNGTPSVIADFRASKPDSLDPAKLVAQLTNHKVTSIIASPFVIRQLSLYVTARKLQVPTLKKIFTGGAPVFPREARLYTQAFPEARVEIVYGSTEAEPISSVNAKELCTQANSTGGLLVGLPYRKTGVRIIPVTENSITADTEDELQVCPAGTIGEIVVSGPHVLREYFNNEEALKRNKIFIGDKCWHRTGDSGYLDENGALFLTGRCSTLIPTATTLITPFTYEDYFQGLEGVNTGTLLKHKGKLTAVLEAGKERSKEEIKADVLKAGVAFDAIVFLEKIPRDPRHNSKIDYARLAEMLT
jgi:acyl-CoA synthetase (AMP-forming)/AMP-acid ligase II